MGIASSIVPARGGGVPRAEGVGLVHCPGQAPGKAGCRGSTAAANRSGSDAYTMRAVAAFPPYAGAYAARPKRPVVGNHRAPIPTAPRSSATGGPSGTSRRLRASRPWRIRTTDGGKRPYRRMRGVRAHRPGLVGRELAPSGSSPSETPHSARDGVLRLGPWLTLGRTVLLNFDE